MSLKYSSLQSSSSGGGGGGPTNNTIGVVVKSPLPTRFLGDSNSETTATAAPPPPPSIVVAHVPESSKKWQHLYVLPVLLLEFLALALTRAVLPALLLEQYGSKVYLVMGCADCVRGLLAFLACPLTGRISDVIGRRICLLVTVMGTCAPVCSLAFFSWETTFMALDASMDNNLNSTSSSGSGTPSFTSEPDDAGDTSKIWPLVVGESGESHYEVIKTHPMALTVFVILLCFSGIFSSTFTLVFAYISDTVRQQDERVSAYGLALATFGLSFTIGPMAGGYLGQHNKQYVFLASLLLTILDLLYIYFILPESREIEENVSSAKSTLSFITIDHKFSWNPWDTLRIIMVDPFLRKVGEVAFLYYTSLWALISTLSVYAVQRFHLTPERLGELMSALGLCTMVAEAVLVRIMVPLLGEKRAMKMGLISFAIQCVVLGFAYEAWHLFICVVFSLLGNLVYPSLSSLVSGSVEPDAVGEALGAVNGIKALTEGIGPLVFGGLMTVSDHSPLPGWPYLIAAVFAAFAYRCADDLPDIEDDEYIHELERKRRHGKSSEGGGILMNILENSRPAQDEEELDGLLSEVEESDMDDLPSSPNDLSRLPITFASLAPTSSQKQESR